MINVSEPIVQRANTDVKASKYAVLYGRRLEQLVYQQK